VRRVLVAVAWPLALVSGALVVIGLLTSLLLALGIRTDGPECRCGDTGPERATAVVRAHVASRDGDDLLLDVDEAERGRVGEKVVVRSFGVHLRPWRHYRLWLFDARGRRAVTSKVGPETLGWGWPDGFRSFSALPDGARMGAVALPMLAASSWALTHGRLPSRVR
jgi:hypothetical protein